MDLGRVPQTPYRTPSPKDIHCVTKWSKLDTVWKGVSVDTLLEGVNTSAKYVMAFSDGGYTTNLPLDDVTDAKAWVAFAFGGAPLEPEHGPGAPPLLLEERQVGARTAADGPGTRPASGRPTDTTCTVTRGASSGTAATDLAPGA